MALPSADGLPSAAAPSEGSNAEAEDTPLPAAAPSDRPCERDLPERIEVGSTGSENGQGTALITILSSAPDTHPRVDGGVKADGHVTVLNEELDRSYSINVEVEPDHILIHTGQHICGQGPHGAQCRPTCSYCMALGLDASGSPDELIGMQSSALSNSSGYPTTTPTPLTVPSLSSPAIVPPVNIGRNDVVTASEQVRSKTLLSY